MSAFLSSIGLPEIVAGVMLVALNAYLLMGGADFGGGAWDLLASGEWRDEQRALIAKSLAPIWEANHVWLIVVVVMLFTGFPAAFATLTTVLHVPLVLVLFGIVLRGSAFVFRSYGARAYAARWGRVFAIASLLTPILLGVVVGAIVSGGAGTAAQRLTTTHASYASVYVAPWLALFPFAVGALTLALCAYLAAVYLTVAATSEELRSDFRRRALGAAVAVFVTAMLALVLSYREAPAVAQQLTASPWAIPFQLATAVAALVALGALWTRRYRVARIAAAAQASLILWGWAAVQFPAMIPPNDTIRDVAAPRITLVLLLWGLAGGSAILLPSLGYLFRTFRAASDVHADQ